MNDVRISITPTEHVIASCNGCFAQNYKPEDNAAGKYVQDLYDIRIGSMVMCLCPDCLGTLEQTARHVRKNRALPEVFAIVKGGDFRLQVVKWKKEITDDGAVRIRVSVGPFTENVYTFATEDAQHLVFDTQAEAEAQLVRLDTRPIE